MARRKRHDAARMVSAPNTGNDPYYVDRTGQEVGSLLVLGDSLRRTRNGTVLWDVHNVETGEVTRISTCNLTRKARALGVPKPS